MSVWQEIGVYLGEIISLLPVRSSDVPVVELGDFFFNYSLPGATNQGFYLYPYEFDKDNPAYTKIVTGCNDTIIEAVVVERPKVRLVLTPDQLRLSPRSQNPFPRFSYAWEENGSGRGILGSLGIKIAKDISMEYIVVLRNIPDGIREEEVLGKKIPWTIPFEAMARRVFDESWIHEFLECLRSE